MDADFDKLVVEDVICNSDPNFHGLFDEGTTCVIETNKCALIHIKLRICMSVRVLRK